ncbi:MAG: Gfo/Idh/MocA family oxidoreductase, partial [Candidatus Marinimicrobia bacterium]|nr:Gfo/Idh/MocA family oxidoreductase [Candidatus Neomarinimicrobiota bacterium]
MNNTTLFKWGIIGTGGIANAFARDIELLDGHMVSSVLSRSEKSAEDFSSQLDNCSTFVNMESFIHNPEIDAVYIATPNTLHAEQTIKALEAKKPVLCEKPFAMNSAEVLSMIK